MGRLVVGIGSEDRGDDAAGLEVARRVRTVEARPTPNPLDLVDLLEQWDEVIVVDAMRSGDPPGTIRRFDLDVETLPRRSFVSSHLVGPAEALELALALGRSASHVVVYGIASEDVEVGSGLSANVQEAVQEVVEKIDNA